MLATVALSVELLITAAMLGAKRKPHAPPVVEYQKEVVLGFSDFKLPSDGTICIGLMASLRSGEFFEGLVRTSGPSGVQFHKGTAPVDTFPENVSIRTQARAFWCGALGVGGPFLHNEFMEALRFEVASQRGLRALVAEQVSHSAYKVPFTELGPEEWVYEIVVRLKQVPLTDALTVNVFSGDGKLLTRITRGLLDPPINPSRVGQRTLKP